MAAISSLKKKLKSVRVTGKLSKAMKTVSAAKFSRLSAAWKYYSFYADQFGKLSRSLTADKRSPNPETVVIIGSNRGFCGGFNNDLVNYFCETALNPKHLVVCGGKMAKTLTENGISYERLFTFDDVPQFQECDPLVEYLTELAEERQDYPVALIYPIYKNPMTQIPTTLYLTLNPVSGSGSGEEWLWIPERDSVCRDIYEAGIHSRLFGAVLSTALGAQAATLVTMRSAYDTALEYSLALEGEIQRLRQSKVTSDVIEVSSERGCKGEDLNV